ncbi:metabolite traffic protein EboE [Thiogranum longum]
MTSEVQHRWRRSDLTYCGNVHPGESLESQERLIAGAIAGVRKARALDTMGSGLWLSDAAAGRLDGNDQATEAFTRILDENGIELFTLNGFPVGGFHDTRVKEKVYIPDWSQPGRLHYTLRLARILSVCLPEACRTGTISTLPLGYSGNWSKDRFDAALGALCRVVQELEKLEEVSGHAIRICLEMEPGCVLEETSQMVSLFAETLPVTARRLRVESDLLRRYLGVCFDICHQAVMFEDPYTSLAALRREQIAIGKIQLSSALEVVAPGDAESRQALSSYTEPRYLHQVRARLASGEIKGVMDLPDALDSSLFPDKSPWRIHYHIPVQVAELAGGRLHTTRDSIGRTLDFLRDHGDVTPHLEVETYTWHVLPAELRPGNALELQQGIANELGWIETQMQQRNLLPVNG